jgi:mono/diheme cytochrome c family protein
MIRPGALCSIVVTALGAVALSGCGGTGVPSAASVDLSQGKQLFVSTCGSCHTMSEAGTAGTIGPNLDAAYAGDRLIGMKVSSFEAMVREQIDLADPPMPRHLLKGAQAGDVAAYIAKVAGVQLAKQYNPGTSPP